MSSARTQTMPLAILEAIETDVDAALAIAIVLIVLAFAGLLVFKGLARLGGRGPVIRAGIRTTVGSFDLAVDLAVDREITVLYGHSGAGKTLTLEAIAGLLTPHEGRIALHDRIVFDSAAGVDVPPQRRDVGYLVQSYALFPHLTVAQNIAYGLGHLSRDERRGRVERFARMFGVDDLLVRRPARISGGQAQRVALARALVREPRVLLLDEPFAAVDSSNRRTMRRELRQLAQRLDLSVVMVTHDLTEAYNVGDRLAVIDRGRVLQAGPRDEVFHRPATARAAELLGVQNILPGRVVGADGGRVHVATGLGLIEAPAESRPAADHVQLAVRAEQIILERPDRPSAERENRFQVTIIDEAAFGFSHTLVVQVDDAAPGAPTLEIDVPAHPYQVLNVPARRDWRIHIPPEAVHVIAG